MPDHAPAETDLVANLRRDLIAAELQILELNDLLKAKDTDRADAVALLGQAELVLEEKIGYIISLDQALNARIRELEQECDRKSAEIDRRGAALEAAQAADTQHRAERDAIIQDLGDRLEAANQEVNRAHQLARDFAEKFNVSAQQLAQARHDHQTLAGHLDATRRDLAACRAELTDRTDRATRLADDLNATTVRLSQAEEQLALERGRWHAVSHSVLWRWSRPWRALFGPKA